MADPITVRLCKLLRGTVSRDVPAMGLGPGRLALRRRLTTGLTTRCSLVNPAPTMTPDARRTFSTTASTRTERAPGCAR